MGLECQSVPKLHAWALEFYTPHMLSHTLTHLTLSFLPCRSCPPSGSVPRRTVTYAMKLTLTCFEIVRIFLACLIHHSLEASSSTTAEGHTCSACNGPCKVSYNGKLEAVGSSGNPHSISPTFIPMHLRLAHLCQNMHSCAFFLEVHNKVVWCAAMCNLFTNYPNSQNDSSIFQIRNHLET